jgi:hypothetical protein
MEQDLQTLIASMEKSAVAAEAKAQELARAASDEPLVVLFPERISDGGTVIGRAVIVGSEQTLEGATLAGNVVLASEVSADALATASAANLAKSRVELSRTIESLNETADQLKRIAK